MGRSLDSFSAVAGAVVFSAGWVSVRPNWINRQYKTGEIKKAAIARKDRIAFSVPLVKPEMMTIKIGIDSANHKIQAGVRVILATLRWTRK